MDIRWKKICIFLMLCAEFGCLVDSASLTASLQPNPAVKGSTRKHTIRCDFSFSEGDSSPVLKLFLNTAVIENLVAATQGGQAEWNGKDVPGNLNQRGSIQGSNDEHYMALVINDTVCDDKDNSYICTLDYSNNGFQRKEDTTAVSVEAAPEAPSEMLITPDSENVTEDSSMTFDCAGNVGRPAGVFHWYTSVGSGSEQNVTDEAVQQPATPAGDGCTFTRSSQLTLNFTRTEGNKMLVVRCRVDHPTQGNSDVSACTDPHTDYCRKSHQISVQYPVSVSVTSTTERATEGDTKHLTCRTQGNPPAYLVEWQKEGENQTMQGNTLQLTEVTFNDAGTYICTAYNIIDGSPRNDSITVTLVVEKKTTPPPTTIPASTQQTTTKKGTESPSKAGAGAGDDNTTIIIIVVVVVVVVLIVAAVAIFVFMRRRKGKKEVEEPPEKPFNNHSGINTIATRPDLVDHSTNHSNVPPFKNEDGLGYAELQFDNKPRSRRPLAIDDSMTDYSDVSMPQV